MHCPALSLDIFASVHGHTRLGLELVSRVTDKFVLLQTHRHFTSPMLRLKPLAGVLSLTAPKQWNSLPSDSCHIQSSHAFKTALKTHLYKQSYNWFQILYSFVPNLPHLLLSSLLHSSLCAPAYLCVCWCVCVQGILYYVCILFFLGVCVYL